MIFRTRTFEVALPVEAEPTFTPGCTACGERAVAGLQTLAAREFKDPFGLFTFRQPPLVREVSVPLCQACISRWLWTPFFRLLGWPVLILAVVVLVMTVGLSVFDAAGHSLSLVVGGVGLTLVLAHVGLRMVRLPLPVHIRNRGNGVLDYHFSQASCARRFAEENRERGASTSC